MKKAFSRTMEPRWADIDANKHLRHSAYFDYASVMRAEWLKENGLPLQHFFEVLIAPVIFREEIQYFREIPLGESVRVDLELAGLDKDYRKWHFRILFYLSSGVLAAKYDAQGAWMDVTNRKIVPPPFDLTTAFAKLKQSDDYAEIISASRSKIE